MREQTVRHRIPAVAGSLVCCLSVLIVATARDASAQSGSGTGGSASGTSGSSVGSSPGGTGPQGGPATGPSPSPPATGLQPPSPAVRPSPVPQTNTGAPAPGSPIYRPDITPGAPTTPQPDAGNPLGTGSEGREPQLDAPIGGSGRRGVGDGSSEASDPLAPTEGHPALGGTGHRPSSISEEPERIKRAGAAGKNLDECLKLWDPDTHMTRDRWKETCERLGR